MYGGHNSSLVSSLHRALPELTRPPGKIYAGDLRLSCGIFPSIVGMTREISLPKILKYVALAKVF